MEEDEAKGSRKREKEQPPARLKVKRRKLKRPAGDHVNAGSGKENNDGKKRKKGAAESPTADAHKKVWLYCFAYGNHCCQAGPHIFMEIPQHFCSRTDASV